MIVGSILNQLSLANTAGFFNSKLLSVGAFLMPDSIIGLKCIFFIWVIIIAGYMITGASERIKNIAGRRQKVVPLGEIIRNECREIRHKEINLNIFSNGIHCMVNKILVYLRVKNGEYIIVLKTDKGCLVETYYDTFPVNNEFSFICCEDEAAKQGETVSISRFNYTLYDQSLEKELIH
jgi:hypothetical protein